MNIAVDYVRPRRHGDPPGADFMIALAHISGVEWEVPVTDVELGKLQPWLPKNMRRTSFRQDQGGEGV